LSNLGLLIMGVGAAWSMTQLTASADMVALVQTALMLPVAIVSAPAAAIADTFDRRKVELVALSVDSQLGKLFCANRKSARPKQCRGDCHVREVYTDSG